MSRRDALIGQVIRALFCLVVVTLGGTLGFYAIWINFSQNPAEHGLLDALYVAVITPSMVGFKDNLALPSFPEPGKTIGEIFSIVLVLVSYGVVLRTSSLIIAYAARVSVIRSGDLYLGECAMTLL